MRLAVSIAAAILILTSCSGNKHQAEPDMQFVRDLGYKYASNYRAMSNNSTEMEREAFLLEVQSKQSRLVNEVGAEYARQFAKAFADSAFVK